MGQPFDLPWAVNPFRAQIDCSAPSYKGGLLPVAQMLWPTDERSEAETAELAEFIVRAVNSHYQLVEALESATVALEEASKVLIGKGLPAFADVVFGHAERNKALLSSRKGTEG